MRKLNTWLLGEVNGNGRPKLGIAVSLCCVTSAGDDNADWTITGVAMNPYNYPICDPFYRYSTCEYTSCTLDLQSVSIVYCQMLITSSPATASDVSGVVNADLSDVCLMKFDSVQRIRTL